MDNKNTQFITYLEKIKFSKHLKRISKKLKNKKVILYGAGAFFQDLNREYDLSCLNIIAISDRKFINHQKGDVFEQYKVCAPDEIKALNPDYVLISMKNIVKVIDDLEEGALKDSKIKIKPLINKPIIEVLNEIWS